MYKKMLVAVISVAFITTVALAGMPDLTWHGTWYTYSFFWSNSDLIKAGDNVPEDGDQHYYMHGSVGLNADFGGGVNTYVLVGAAGCYGRDPIFYIGPEPAVWLRECYLNVSNLFDSPLSLKLGKQHVLYGDQFFDGGEDGIMGAKLSYVSDMFDFDLFSFRLMEFGGTGYIGFPWGWKEDGYYDRVVPDDYDLHGFYSTFKFMDGCMTLSPYALLSMWSYYSEYDKDCEGSDKPMWLGVRLDGTPVPGLTLTGEFTKIMGSYEETWDKGEYTEDYTGMHYMARLGYTPPGMPVTIGGAYVYFSGDKIEEDKNDNNEYGGYFTPIYGPYTFGFYKGWPGFGPAHLMMTAYGFSLVGVDPLVTNLSVINGNIGYTSGPFTIRGDYFMYSFNEVPEDIEKAIGNEIAVLVLYNYNGIITFGATAGMLMPGAFWDDYYGEDADLGNCLGGYLFTAIGF